MAERKPLVIISGEQQELPAGDTLPPDPGKVNNATGSSLTFDVVTQAEFDALSPPTAGWVYLITE